MSFSLHPRLAAGSHEFGRLGGCRVLLKDNALFPWFLLVPEVGEEIVDLHQLKPEGFREVTQAIRDLSGFVSNHFEPDKLNVAAIGNQVRQLHIHVVGRSVGDSAWPGVVWSHDGKAAYAPEVVEEIRLAYEDWRSGVDR